MRPLFVTLNPLNQFESSAAHLTAIISFEWTVVLVLFLVSPHLVGLALALPLKSQLTNSRFPCSTVHGPWFITQIAKTPIRGHPQPSQVPLPPEENKGNERKENNNGAQERSAELSSVYFPQRRRQSGSNFLFSYL